MQEFIVSLSQYSYIHSFVLPKTSERGATAPLATPLNPPMHLETPLLMEYGPVPK